MNPNIASIAEPADGEDTATVRVNGDLVELADRSPTGLQILAAAGLRPAADYALLRWPNHGPTSEVGLDDVLDLIPGSGAFEFFAIKAGGVSYFTLDEERYAWAGAFDEPTLRRLGRLGDGMQVWLERTGQPDRQLDAGEAIKLEREGVERFNSRKPIWKLEVQGEPTEWEQPLVLVRDAIVKAGFDPSKAWTIKLKVKGEAIRDVQQTDTIDLSQPGVERLRVRPSHVDNGDGSNERRRDFSLLEADVAFLTASGFEWQTIIDGHRWLIVDNYPMPPGYNVPSCRLAVDIPSDYPTAQLDMFFCDPTLTANGGAPPNTEVRQAINGVSFQRWSRHRGAGSSWTPGVDNLASHFALIEQAIGREVGV